MNISTPGIALITGAASGIGRDTAYAFAEAGAAGIVFADRNRAGAEETANKAKEFANNPAYRGYVVVVDVTDEASVQNMVDTAVKEFGRIDYSINSAGLGHETSLPISELSIGEFDRTHDVNSRGLMLCMRAVSKVMSSQEPLKVKGRRAGERSLGRGSIVNMGSANSYVGFGGALPYAASKHAVMGMTKTAALDLVPNHIRVNAICPSWIHTPMMQPDFDRIPGFQNWISQVVPVGRMAELEEVSDYIVFLCSPSGSYINGTGLMIDAGLTLTIHTGL